MDEWKLVFGILYNKNMSLKFKAKFYKVIIRLNMLYEVECYLDNNSHIRKINTTEIIFVQMNVRYARKGNISKEGIGYKGELNHRESETKIV